MFPLFKKIVDSQLRTRALQSLALLLCPAWLGAAHGAELEVRVVGERLRPGMVGCALYAGEAGFPMDASRAKMVWLPWQSQGVLCRFTDLAAGRYAVSVMNDENGNQLVDTNFLGMPKEAWGVSNNARPSLRPPRFDEAVFQLDAVLTRVEVRLAK